MNSIPITIDLIGLGSASDEVWLIFRYEKKPGFPCSTSGPLAQHPFLPSFALPSFFFAARVRLGALDFGLAGQRKPKNGFRSDFFIVVSWHTLLPSSCYRVFVTEFFGSTLIGWRMDFLVPLVFD